MKAYVLLTTAPQKGDEVASAAGEMKGVTRAERIKGIYDLMCLIESEDKRGLYEIVLNGLRGIAGVTGAETCFVEEGP